jgi:hypothetical protein
MRGFAADQVRSSFDGFPRGTPSPPVALTAGSVLGESAWFVGHDVSVDR